MGPGSESDLDQQGDPTHGAQMVIRLAEPFTGKGRNVTCDNYFTDYLLCQKLHTKKTTLVGTVRRDKRFLSLTMMGLGQFFHHRRAINAQTYVQDVLQAHVVPYTAMHRNIHYIVSQQDNARAHTARYTQQFLEQSNVQVLPWPALLPDLNPIDCGITCRGGWTVKTIDLKTPMILNIPYEGTGMLFQDIFTDSSIFDGTPICCCTGSPRGGGHTHY
ncbi:transposable element Tcb1 transposase [Elysia marginata]|uniref:Transposable element Tcb1 transposase n=1 Tax=Elysia marginata TaxID=1093978 RepID=A0AAV4EPI2_9GAST|nr:transposable element Tcb1 transposase [Elysia marginata]